MNRRASTTFGVLLILIGGWFMAVNFVPSLESWALRYLDWPFWIVGFGFIFFVAAFTSGVGGLAVPGFIIMGVGGILAYQNATNDWESWAYAWTIFPGLVGIGLLFSNTIEGRFRKGLREAGPPLSSSIIMFLLFSTFFRSIFGQEPLLGDYWPVLLILVGVWMLIRNMFFPRRRTVRIVTNGHTIIGSSHEDEDMDDMDVEEDEETDFKAEK